MEINTYSYSDAELCEILGERNAKVIIMRRENKTLNEIGQIIGVTKQRVGAIIAHAERKTRYIRSAQNEN